MAVRKKRNYKVCAAALFVAMTVASLAGCAGGGSPASTNEETVSKGQETAKAEDFVKSTETVTYPIEESGKKLTLAWDKDANFTPFFDTLQEAPMGKQLMEETGVELEYSHYDSTQMNLMMASGELPDIIYFPFASSYAGGVEKAIKDGVIQTIPYDMVEKYAPDFLNYVIENDYIKDVTASNGEFYGFPFIRGSEWQSHYMGIVLRHDWLEELNLEVPETPEEFYDVLVAFRDKKGAKAPFSLTTDELLNHGLEYGMITSPFGLVQLRPYHDGDEVHLGYTEPEYKDCLAFLNKLYTDGLLDSNFTTLDGATKNAAILNGDTGATIGLVGGGIGSIMSAAEKTDPDFDLIGIKSLVKEKGETPMAGFYDYPVSRTITVITSACEDVETALKVLNYGYTEKGSLLYNFGQEGKSYTMVDGKPVYTEDMTNNPDGLPMIQALSWYCRVYSAAPFVCDESAMEQYAAGRPQQKEAFENWSISHAADYCIPPAAVIEEADLSEFASLYSDIDTYVKEMSLKFIRGIEPLDHYDEYLETLKSMGSDRLKELYQTAWDNYSSK